MSRAAWTCIAMSASMNWMPWNAASALAGIHGGEHTDHARVVSVGAPLLRSVQHVVIAAQDRRRLETGGVRARARLGQRVRREQLTGREPRQVLLLLLLGAGEED